MNFFFDFYSPTKVLQKLTSILVAETNLRLLDLKLTKTLCAELKISKAYFILVSDVIDRPINSLDIVSNPNIVRNEKLEQLLHRVKTITLYENLLIVPLIVGDEDIGLLILEPKISKAKYSKKDIKLLNIFAPQAAIALKNAAAYQKIQQLSRTLETKVIERTHELEESQAAELKLKDEFVFIATHDLATPIAAISGFAALINKSGENLSRELKNYLSAIIEASDRLKVLANDLLQIARSESGTIKLNLTPLNANQILESTIREITPLANEKKITITSNIGNENIILADQLKLSEVFSNLLSNAVKYNKVGGSIIISTFVSDNQTVFEFKDTGIGIPVSEQSKVFTKFFRSDSAEARSRPGTGLGLFVARMLTEKMGGKISFESVDGQGTTFKLAFNR